jgi:hypothetical protein
MAIRFAVAATACIALIALAHHHWPLPPRLDSFDADESDYRSDGLTA